MKELDIYDKKILAYLDINSRISLTNLAKKINLSKQNTLYRINRLKENQIIDKFITAINFSKLGYNHIKFYFKLNKIDSNIQNQLIEFWDNKKSIWIASCYGLYDFAVTLLVDNLDYLGKVYNEFTNKFSEYILDKELLISYSTNMLNRQYILEENQKTQYIHESTKKTQYKIDDTEKKLLKEIANNSRINSVDLKNKTNINYDIIRYRIKKLENNNIILQYKIFINYKKLGVALYKILLKLKDNYNQLENIKKYTINHRNGVQYLRLIGRWDCELEFEVNSEKHFQDILLDIRNKFSESILDYSIIRITNHYKFDYSSIF